MLSPLLLCVIDTWYDNCLSSMKHIYLIRYKYNTISMRFFFIFGIL